MDGFRLIRSIKINNSSSGLSLRISIASLLTLALLFGSLYYLVPSFAGTYHSGSTDTLACSQCHTMHDSEGGSSMAYEGPGLQAKLLRASTVVKLCLHCHENNSAGLSSPTPPDVLNNTINGIPDAPTRYIASAGDFQHDGVINEDNRHSIGTDVSGGPPGYTAGNWSGGTGVTDRYSTNFNCVYCHTPHGNINYRNLRFDPGNPTNDTEGAGVTISHNTPKADWPATACTDGDALPCDVELDWRATTLAKYTRGNINFYANTANSDYYNPVSEWCGKCHGTFFGQSGEANMDQSGLGANAAVGPGDDNSTVVLSPWTRHPVGDVEVGNTNGHSVDVIPAGGAIYARTDDSGGPKQPLCLSCHFAHGGGNYNSGIDPELDHSMLVVFDTSGDVNMTHTAVGTYATGEGMVRNTCNQCHNQ
jgi:hypothetical protein